MREDEVSDLRPRMEELYAAGLAVTEEIGWIKENLSSDVAAFLSQEEVVQIREELEKKRCAKEEF